MSADLRLYLQGVKHLFLSREDISIDIQVSCWIYEMNFVPNLHIFEYIFNIIESLTKD